MERIDLLWGIKINGFKLYVCTSYAAHELIHHMF